MKSTTIDFSGQHLFIGIDTHARQWKITVRTLNTPLRTLSINPDPKDLWTFLHKHYPGAHYSSVYEAGFCGFWIHRQLHEYGINNIIVNPADIPTSHKEKDYRNDVIDSRKLARELSNNNLIAIYVPSEIEQHLRSLSRVRAKTSQNITRVCNRIKAHLHFNGIKIPSRSETAHWSARFILWLENVEFSHQPGKDALLIYLEELKEHRKRLLKVMRLLRQYASEAHLKPLFELLYTIPGVGFITAITLLCRRMKKQDAIVRIAKKLLSRIRYVWLNHQQDL